MKRPTRELALFVALSALLLHSAAAKDVPLDNSDRDKRALRALSIEEYETIKGRWENIGDLIVDDSETISSLEAVGVRLGLGRIRKDLANVDSAARLTTLQFYLAHEAWHQRQYKIYAGYDILGDSEQSRLMECQADVMAAEMIGEAVGYQTLC